MQPDILTLAKGLTCGAVPMGGVIVRRDLRRLHEGPGHAMELFHGYTYSGHPLASAAALAALDVYREERCSSVRRRSSPSGMTRSWASRACPTCVDIRCVGLTGAIDLAPVQGSPGERVRRALDHAFFDAGVMIRPAGDTIELTPPLIVSENEIGEIMDKVGASIKAAA